MKLLKFKKIQKKLTFWFLVMALVPLLISLGYSYIQQSKEIKSNTYDKLQAIRDLKVDRLKSWITERKGDLITAATDVHLSDLEIIIDKDTYGEDNLNILNNSRNIIISYLNNYEDYDEIFIIDPHTGKILISTKSFMEGEDKSQDVYFTKPLETREIYIKGIYRSESTGNKTMTFSIPIFCHQHQKKHIVGILVTRVNLENSLYALLQNRVGLGKTGETLIVNEDVVVLNELRWYQDAPLNLRIDADPAVNAAVKKETGVSITEDYRGEKVIAAYTHIPEMNWGFVCKQDVKELYAAHNKARNSLLFISIILVIMIYFSTVKISKTMSKPIVAMNKAAKKLGAGDYSARVKIKSQDEIGSLAQSINSMAVSINSREIEKSNTAMISETMIGLSTRELFSEQLVKKIMEFSDSQMGVFYILDDAEQTFLPLYSLGANNSLLRPFSADEPEGELNIAIASKRIYHFQNIPDTTTFKFITVAGHAIPKEIISIPLLMNDKVVAIISLASLNCYSEESISALNISWNNLNLAYTNLVNSEHNRIIAERLTRANQHLEAQTEELQQQSEELIEQSEELKHTSEELQEQNLELEQQKIEVMEANRLKSEFLSNMSHELRTPLNSILALSNILKLQTADKITPEESNYLEIVHRNGKRLLALINDILDLSKIEAGKMDIHPTPASIGSILGNIKDSLDPLAKEKGIGIALNISANLPLIETDSQKLYQVIQNIVGNAVKFTDKGFVKIFTDFDDRDVFINILDTGIGIAETDITHIFEEFRQVDGSASRKYEGTGLGLAIANKLAHILHGNISVKSELEKGSLFTISLPLKWQGEVNFMEQELTLKPMINYQTTDIKSGNGARILLVEDNESTIIQVRSILLQKGYDVATASGGKQALEYVKHTIPDGIILDLMMPEVDGFEVLENIRNTKLTRSIPVLILTAKDLDKSDLAKISANNVQQLVQKGDIDLSGLLTKVQNMLGNKPNTASLGKNDRREVPEILIVEDNPDNMITLKAIIGDRYVIKEAYDGLKGLQYIVSGKPDLVLLDISLPKIDGIEIVKMLKSGEETKHIPVIAVTARAGKEDEEELLEAGCDDYISKPVDAELLIKKLKKWLVD